MAAESFSDGTRLPDAFLATSPKTVKIYWQEILNKPSYFTMEDSIMEDSQQEPQDISQETPVVDVFIPPSIHREQVLLGDSYTHHSAIPATVKNDMTTECVLGVDEAGRGPVLGT